MRAWFLLDRQYLKFMLLVVFAAHFAATAILSKENSKIDYAYMFFHVVVEQTSLKRISNNDALAVYMDDFVNIFTLNTGYSVIWYENASILCRSLGHSVPRSLQ